LLLDRPRLRVTEAGLEGHLARAALDGDARDQAIAEEGELRRGEARLDSTGDPLAAAAGLAPDDPSVVLAQRLERRERLVLVACDALLDDGVLLHGDPHQADDHVRPVRRLTALDALLGLPQLRDQ